MAPAKSSLMEIVAKSIAQHAPTLIAILLVAVAILALLGLRLWHRVRSIQSRWELLLQESSGSNLERLLNDHLDERRALIRDHLETRDRLEIIEDKMEASKRHLGIVRYDAFEEVGGAQSFALAIYDDRGDGVILTSLVGRADCRVYGKSLTRGRSERTLSQEEQRAIDEAQRQLPRPIIAP